MAGVDFSASVMLAPKVQEIIKGVDDGVLRQEVERTLRLCLGALIAIGRLHLPQDHFEVARDSRQRDDKFLELAPYVLEALRSINQLVDYMVKTFPVPESSEAPVEDDDFDFEFDLADDDSKKDEQNVLNENTENERPPRERVAEATYAYGSMVRNRVLNFASRLRMALQDEDSWPLLAELDDNQHRLSKSIQGVFFGVISVFADGVRREELYPEYRSAVADAISLRSAIAELSFHIARFNTALAQADKDTCIPLIVGVADRLTRFAGRPEYRTMRAEDKKSVIDFRRELHNLRHAGESLSVAILRRSVEGFSKFLESMQAINHREVLVLHDRQRLEEAMVLLAQINNVITEDMDVARDTLEQLVAVLSAVHGRNPDLDEMLRGYYSSHQTLQHETLAEQLPSWRFVIEGVLATVG